MRPSRAHFLTVCSVTLSRRAYSLTLINGVSVITTNKYTGF
jgi:hypothetical protein